ncbi:MAG: hypothetical protein KDD67_11680 [Ignavibacteriae bacterium]|nr:hypothetical protein [Ignavibacteriota bacterium]MCB9214967.1 hypothetical protein [Ignavibacteria bacterium]
MLRLFCLLTGIFFFLSTSADTTAQSWQLMPMPMAGSVTCFNYNPETGTILAGTNLYGIFRSTDQGNSWELVDSLTGGASNTSGYGVRAITFVDGTFWAHSTQGRLIRSDDDGQSWALVALLGGVPQYPYNIFVEGDLIILGRHRSTDKGKTWHGTQTPGGIPSRIIRLGNRLFTSANGVFISTDDGETWVEGGALPKHSPSKLVTPMVAKGDTLIAFNSWYLHISVDSGKSWQAQGEAWFRDVEDAVVLNDDLYLFDKPGLLRSKDLGQSWDTILGDGVVPITAYAQNSLLLVGSESHGVLRTETFSNQAKRFDWYQTGIVKPGSGLIDEYKVIQTSMLFDQDTLWVTANNGIFSLGPNDQLMRLRLPISVSSPQPSLSNLGNGQMYVLGRGINSTTNNYWEQFEQSTAPGLPIRVGEWLITEKLYRSSDEGATWTPIPAEEVNGQLTQLLAVDSVLLGRFSTGTGSSALWRSTDVGETWTEIDLDVQFHLYGSLHYHDGVVTATGINMLYYSHNSGENWDSIAFDIPDMSAVNTIHNQGRFYTSTRSIDPISGTQPMSTMVYAYQNGSWSPIVEGLPDTMLIENSDHAVWTYQMLMNGSDLYLYGQYIYRYNTAILSVESTVKRQEHLDLR